MVDDVAGLLTETVVGDYEQRRITVARRRPALGGPRHGSRTVTRRHGPRTVTLAATVQLVASRRPVSTRKHDRSERADARFTSALSSHSTGNKNKCCEFVSQIVSERLSNYSHIHVLA